MGRVNLSGVDTVHTEWDWQQNKKEPDPEEHYGTLQEWPEGVGNAKDEKLRDRH